MGDAIDLRTVVELLRAGGSAVLVVVVYLAIRLVKINADNRKTLRNIERHLARLSRRVRIRNELSRPKE